MAHKIPAHKMNKVEREYRATKIAERKIQAGLKTWPDAGPHKRTGTLDKGYCWHVPCAVTVSAKEIEDYVEFSPMDIDKDLLACFHGATIQRKGVNWVVQMVKIIEDSRTRPDKVVVDLLKGAGLIAKTTYWCDVKSVSKVKEYLRIRDLRKDKDGTSD